MSKKLAASFYLGCCAVTSAFLITPSQAQVAQTKATPAASGKTTAGKSTEPKLGPAKIIANPGLWETTITAVLDNGSTRSSQSLVCVTPADLRSPEVLLPTHSVVGLKCANRDIKFKGNIATWKVTCLGNGQAVEGENTLTFAATSQTGSGKMEHGVGGKTVKTQQKISAKLMGPC